MVERGSPHSLPLMESGKLLPGVSVIIADPESKGQCGDSNLGEIWVECPHNASGYYTIYGEDGTYGDHFAARLIITSFHLMLILDVKARHWEQHSANICPDRISWLPQKD